MKFRTFLAAVTLWTLCAPHLYAAQEHNATVQNEQSLIPLRIKGIHALDVDEIDRAIGVEVPPKWEFWKDSERRIASALVPSIGDALRNYLDARGYYDATFQIRKAANGIVIRIRENRPVRVAKITIQSDFPIRRYITFKTGEAFDSERFVTIKKRIRSALLAEGYCSYDLDTKAYVDLDKRSVDLVYRLRKGGLCRFGNTTVVQKPDSIPPEVILSRMRYRPGDIFTTRRINESYAALNDLGVFGQTLIDTETKYFNVIRPKVSVRLREKLHRYTFAAGYDSEAGFRIKGTYDQYNFFGGGRSVELLAQYSSKDARLNARFFQPALFSIADCFMDFSMDVGVEKHSYDDYDERKLYWKANVHYADGTWSWDAGLGLERLVIDQTDTPSIEDLDFYPGVFTTAYGYARIVYDRRDDKHNPKEGYYLAGYGEFGYSIGGFRNDPYSIIGLEGHWIHTVGEWTFAAVGKAAVLDDRSKASLPASKYLYAGGVYSNRAYGDREIGITLSPTKDLGFGGRTRLNASFEAEYALNAQWYGAAFYDATLISPKAYSTDSAHWIQSVGIGVRYLTPIGPLTIDYGVNLHDRSIRRFSILLGQSF